MQRNTKLTDFLLNPKWVLNKGSLFMFCVAQGAFIRRNTYMDKWPFWRKKNVTDSFMNDLYFTFVAKDVSNIFNKKSLLKRNGPGT